MSSTSNSLKWSAIERLVTQFIQLLVMLYLARLIGPQSFGLVGMLAVFISISQVLVDSGFSSALIRNTERKEIDFSTTFYFNICVGLLCYGVLFFSAPAIAHFFEEPQLINLLRVLGLVVIINSFATVQRAKLTIKMDFKTQAKASLLSVIISCCLALWLAKMEFGVWALVGQTLSHNLGNVILLNLFLKWIPTTGFSKSSFSYLFGFGSKLLAASLLDTVFKNIYQIVIGKQFNSTQVGMFTQANQLASVPSITMTTIIQRVTYPMLSNIQNDTNKFEQTYLLTLRLAAVVVFPLMVGLAISATPLISIVLGDEWLPAAELLTLLCFAFMLYPIHAINLNLLKVKGRSDIFLRLEIIKKIITICILFITLPLGVKEICIGIVSQSYLALVINTFYTGKLSKLKMALQFKLLIPIWLGSVLCGAISYYVSDYLNLFNNLYVHLIMNVSIMPLLYISYIRITQRDLYSQIIKTVFKKSAVL